MKDIYILKEMNEIILERIHADNQLKRFNPRNAENLLTKQIETYEILNVASGNSIDAIKNSNIVNKDVRINDEIWNKVVRDIVESSNIDDQIFEDIITDDNLSNSKI